MRVWRFGAGIGALSALLLPAAAHANEMLVMPYTCSMMGGQPLLTPSPERGYRVLGPRDQRRFSACSPVNPDLCRQWTVYRFDLDCNGTRVPWVSVVAATNEGSRRAWLLDGRLVLRMGPQWSLPPDDPCAQEPGADRRFEYRRMRRYCTDRLAIAPPPVVELPFGYAPMLGIDGIFVKGGPNVAGSPPLPPVAAAPPGPPAGRPVPSNPMPDLFPTPPQSDWPGPSTDQGSDEAPAQAAPVVPPQVAPQPPQPPPAATAAAPQAPPAPPPSAPAPAAAEAPKVAPAESASATSEIKPAPKVAANTPASKAASGSPPAPPPATEAPKPTAKPAPIVTKSAAPDAPKGASAPPPAKTAEPAAAPSEQGPEPGGGGLSISLLSVFRTTTVGALVAFGGLALGLLAAFALARRNEHIHDSRRRRRDLASVSLDNKRKAPARLANARGNLPPNAAVSVTSRMPGQNGSRTVVAAWGDGMPQTRADAMQMLGIGVTPTANEAAIKKIVDGLRQSWHPDHAKDDDDRAQRELRSKQINAAWELLRSQRAEV
jgi:hypothetical protein